jgi:glycosyltransferase involved in cell wall biosynthesis
MKKKYNLLITISEFMYSSQLRNLCDLVSLLDKNIFEIEIGALATGDSGRVEVEKLGVPYYPLRLQPDRNMSWKKFCDLIKGPYVIFNKKYDLVHSLLYQCLCTEPLFIKLLTSAKYIYTKSNLEWHNHKFNWALKSHLADKIISISNATDALLIEKGFGEKIQKIYLGIDTNVFQESFEKRKSFRATYNIPDSSLVYGCAAQFVEWKEHLTVIHAFESLADSYENIYLVLCGFHQDDSYFHSVMKRIKSSIASDRILYLGVLSDMASFYSGIDCFVLPSRNETFGYVYIEAMSCNRPVIACRAAGPLEIVEENETGLFMEMSSVGDLFKQMEKYIRNRDILVEHGKKGRRRVVEVFSKEVMAKKFEELYLKLLD